MKNNSSKIKQEILDKIMALIKSIFGLVTDLAYAISLSMFSKNMLQTKTNSLWNNFYHMIDCLSYKKTNNTPAKMTNDAIKYMITWSIPIFLL